MRVDGASSQHGPACRPASSTIAGAAVRNLIRASVRERVAMLLTGHKSRTIFDRDNIIHKRELLQVRDGRPLGRVAQVHIGAGDQIPCHSDIFPVDSPRVEIHSLLWACGLLGLQRLLEPSVTRPTHPRIALVGVAPARRLAASSGSRRHARSRDRVCGGHSLSLWKRLRHPNREFGFSSIFIDLNVLPFLRNRALVRGFARSMLDELQESPLAIR